MPQFEILSRHNNDFQNIDANESVESQGMKTKYLKIIRKSLLLLLSIMNSNFTPTSSFSDHSQELGLPFSQPMPQLQPLLESQGKIFNAQEL